jgi:peroxiredoxin family protein
VLKKKNVMAEKQLREEVRSAAMNMMPVGMMMSMMKITGSHLSG